MKRLLVNSLRWCCVILGVLSFSLMTVMFFYWMFTDIYRLSILIVFVICAILYGCIELSNHEEKENLLYEDKDLFL